MGRLRLPNPPTHHEKVPWMMGTAMAERNTLNPSLLQAARLGEREATARLGDVELLQERAGVCVWRRRADGCKGWRGKGGTHV